MELLLTYERSIPSFIVLVKLSTILDSNSWRKHHIMFLKEHGWHIWGQMVMDMKVLWGGVYMWCKQDRQQNPGTKIFLSVYGKCRISRQKEKEDLESLKFQIDFCLHWENESYKVSQGSHCLPPPAMDKNGPLGGQNSLKNQCVWIRELQDVQESTRRTSAFIKSAL